MFEARLSLQVHDTNPLLFPQRQDAIALIPVTEACSANDKQLTFQYFM